MNTLGRSIPLLLLAAAAGSSAEERLPKPKFQNDFFGAMGRSFCVVTQVDPKSRILTVKKNRDGSSVAVPIRDDTELHVRDSWGRLEDFFPGQEVMLFMYVDEEGHWTYPRAVQDDIHVAARHGWFAAVTKIDREKASYATHREERNKDGAVTKVEEKEYAFTPEVKVWKGETAGGIESLQVGDEVIQQLVEREGKLAAVEILDRKGDEAVRAAQDLRHRQDEEVSGLPAYVTDLEVLSGALTVTVSWNSSERAKELKTGNVVTVVPGSGEKAFAAAIVATHGVDSRMRLEVAVNARVAARLAYGESLRVYLPGMGPAIPTGLSGVPEGAWQ